MKLAYCVIVFSVMYYLAAAINAQDITKIFGRVTDEDNNPLPYVNVYILNSFDGSMTDEKGKYSFTTRIKDDVILTASIIGHKKYNEEINPGESENINIEITLFSETIELAETIISGSSFSSEERKGVVLSSMDVYTTPGGAADFFQSLKTMPGLTQVSESAEPYVRGGDPIETVTMIDGASLYHPYTYESSYGGLFSNLNTGNIKNMFFSSGGFSAKYGNVLSGVLDIESRDEPQTSSYRVDLSMASVMLSADIPILDYKFGFRVIAQQSFTKPIMWLNGELEDFATTPSSHDISTSVSFKYSKTGRLKFFGLYANDEQGVNVERAEYEGVFKGNSENKLFSLRHSDILFDRLLIKTSLSYNCHNNHWKLGLLDLDKIDEVYKVRSDLEITLNKFVKLNSGIEYEARNQNFVGVIPGDDFNLRPDGNREILNAKISGTRIGTYAEFEISNLLDNRNLFVIPGVRLDFIPQLSVNWIDPRFGIGYKINDNSTLKFGSGIFHQIPDARLFSKTDGNPDLKPMKAYHFILSYDLMLTVEKSFRVEFYRKVYDNLPLENTQLNYNNDGYGYANGFDIIAKGFFPFDFRGWISYGFINTKRRWMDFTELTNSTYNITHNFSIVVKYNLSAMWEIGASYKYATGRPYTPIVESIFRNEQNVYEPIYGIKNSERYPDYYRLDLRLTHLNQIFNKYFTIVYIEALNILNIKNLFGYSYNKDYSQKTKIQSYFGRRTIVIGVQVNL